MDRDKIRFDFMVHRQERGAYDDEIESNGGRIFRMPPIHPRFFPQYFRALDSFFNAHRKYRIVHSHLDLLSAYVLRAAKQNGVPVRIAHSHSSFVMDTGPRKLFKIYSRHILKNYYTHAFTCGVEAGKFLFGAREKNVFMMRNAIDTRKFSYDEEMRWGLRNRLGINENALVIGHVGRFDYGKNQSFLLDILAQLRKDDTDACLLLVGEGEMQETVRRRAGEMGLSDKVFFIGVTPDVNLYMNAMDIFVMPSHYEGFPVVAVEAQASGLPFLASENVSREIKLTDPVDFLSLSDGAVAWAKRAMELVRYDRKQADISEILEDYDIVKESVRIQSVYFAMMQDGGGSS
jgi:glycosyltransferase involved in cell wall biosynthesis